MTKASKNQDYCKNCNELKTKLDVATRESENRLEDLKYLQADFENLRKNFDKEKGEIIKLATRKLVEDLLTTLDDFDSALKHLKDEDDKNGMQVVYQKFIKAMSQHGLKKMDISKDDNFDHELHEVVLRRPSEKDDGVILEIVQSGYHLNNSVLRYAKVIVSQKQNGGA